MLSSDTEEAIAYEQWQEEQKKIKAIEKKQAEENFGQNMDDTALASVFGYLSEDILEEIQHTDIVERINDEANKKLLVQTTKKKTAVVPEKNPLYENKNRTVVKKQETKVEIEETKVEEKSPVVAVVDPIKPEIEPEIKLDVEPKVVTEPEKSKFNAAPYVAGGAGLLGLFIIFLLVFKRDDDDDEKKKNPPNSEVNV